LRSPLVSITSSAPAAFATTPPPGAALTPPRGR
jgi:hypothetical protein